jgi:hypothetical protein
VVVKPGVYAEAINLKPYVSIIGSSPVTTKIVTTNEPTLLANFDNVATSSSASVIADVTLQLNGDVTGQPVAAVSNAGVKFERVNFNWIGEIGEVTASSSALVVNGSGEVDLLNVNIYGSAYGIKQTVTTDGANANIYLAYSNVNATVAGIKTVCQNATGADCDANVSNPTLASINSSYTIYSGNAFDVALGTAVATSHDTYASYSGKGRLILNDYNRNLVDVDSSVFVLQNAGNELLNVKADGRMTINLQNTAGDGVVITGATDGSVLKVVNNGTGSALTVAGDLVVTSAASSTQAAITAGGGTLQIGRANDVIDLSVDGVTYKFKENVRRNTLSAFVSLPKTGDKVWGGEGNSWTPPENIEVLGFKMQYKCSTDGYVKLALKDKDGNVLKTLDSKNCSDYGSDGVDDLRLPISKDNGLFVEFLEALGEVGNVTITVEFVYENR